MLAHDLFLGQLEASDGEDPNRRWVAGIGGITGFRSVLGGRTAETAFFGKIIAFFGKIMAIFGNIFVIFNSSDQRFER